MPTGPLRAAVTEPPEKTPGGGPVAPGGGVKPAGGPVAPEVILKLDCVPVMPADGNGNAVADTIAWLAVSEAKKSVGGPVAPAGGPEAPAVI